MYFVLDSDVTHEINQVNLKRYRNRVTMADKNLLTHSKNGKRSFNVIFWAVS